MHEALKNTCAWPICWLNTSWWSLRGAMSARLIGSMVVAIKPSGVEYDALTPDKIVLLD